MEKQTRDEDRSASESVGLEEGSESMKVLRDVTDPSRQERELHEVTWAD